MYWIRNSLISKLIFIWEDLIDTWEGCSQGNIDMYQSSLKNPTLFLKINYMIVDLIDRIIQLTVQLQIFNWILLCTNLNMKSDTRLKLQTLPNWIIQLTIQSLISNWTKLCLNINPKIIYTCLDLQT